MSITGSDAEQPTKVGVPIADLLTGMNGDFGVVAALYEREHTGYGRVVRTSLLAGIVGVHAFQGTMWTVAGQVPEMTGAQHASIAPYGLFHTATAPVQVACGSESLWRSFAAVAGLDAADPRFATNAERVGHRAELVAAIEDVFAAAPAEHWLELLADVGIPAGKVRTIDDVYEWEQTRSQGLLVEVDHATQGPVSLPGPVLRLDDNAYAGGQPSHLPPPTLGQHSEEIRAWLEPGTGNVDATD
jgi:crotonobetainyl-CoA:carnitine CoA-transferase CaiB-like acyl-CoA transferase